MANFEEVICPFCKEPDFDLLGLEMHLQRGWCPVFGNLNEQPRCTEERPCVNCFADSGPCLGPHETQKVAGVFTAMGLGDDPMPPNS